MVRLIAAAAISMALAALVPPATAQTQAEMNEQAGVKFHHADAELNTLYRDLMKKVSTPGQAKLHAAQQAWLKFRDAECEFETAGTIGGSINPMVFSHCLTGLTLQRNQQLKAQLTCQEGDLSCGGQ